MVELLNSIYEQDFLDCSYGFQPGRGQHQALDEVGRVICCTRRTGWILEIDITAYFDSIVREQLMEMIEKRVSDGSVLRMIRKWINIGVIEEGRLLMSETGITLEIAVLDDFPSCGCVKAGLGFCVVGPRNCQEL